jgi:mono/diheme cytochrome c family protein
MRALSITLVFATLAVGCIGAESEEAPVVGIRNMYNQPRYDTQERRPFFADQRSMRPGVDGTVAREDTRFIHWDSGRTASNDGWVMEVPEKLVARSGGAAAFVARGKDRYEVFCAPCHSLSGDGKGMVSRRAAAIGASGLVAPSFHDDRLRRIPDGQLYATIRNGLRNMPAYAHNIPVQDRWAIVQYIRALQLSQLPEKTEQSQ